MEKLFEARVPRIKSFTDKNGSASGDEGGVIGTLLVDRHGEDEALRLDVMLLHGTFVPHFIYGAVVDLAEVVVGDGALLVLQEVLPSRQTAASGHERQRHAETLLELFPTRRRTLWHPASDDSSSK